MFLDSPLGQLPYLTVNGVKLPQSIAIARFAAKKANLYGSDDLEQAKTDAVIDTLSDVQNIYYKKVFNGKPEDRDLNVKSFLTDDAPTHLGNLEKLIKLWGSNGYSVGSSLKWSDLQIYAVTYELKTLDSNLLSKYPAVEAVVKSVESNPKVAEYLKTRPDAAF